MFQDRRTYPRRKAMLSLKVSFGDAELSSVTTDISPTGAFFAARTSPPIGSIISIVVRPTGVKIAPVRLAAEVVRVNPIGGNFQPGFAVHFVSAHSDAGGAAIYHVLRQVLRLPEILPEHLPEDGAVVFRFAEVGEQIDVRSAQAQRSVSSHSTAGGSGARLTGRPIKPIQDAMPRHKRRGSRIRPPANTLRHAEALRRLSENDLRRSSEVPLQRRRSSAQRPEFAARRGPSSTSRRASEHPAPPLSEATQPIRGARRISAEQKNAFTGARLVPAGVDSGIFAPPGSPQGAASSPFSPPQPPTLESPSPTPAAPSFAPVARTPSANEATFSVKNQEDSGMFSAEQAESSQIVAPFTDQAAGTTRRRSQASSWSVYESGIQDRVSVRRTSDIVIQDDPFATGARKVAARFREKAEQTREKRRAERESEREQLRAKLERRRRVSQPLSAAFSVDGDGGERSMIFARSGQASTIGGPMLTGVAASPALPDNATVAVQTPITYEIDGRFVPGTVVSAAALAVEIHSLDRVPQLDQKLVVNFPVHEKDSWRTIFLMGKLLRVPEERDGGQSFVLHIERVQEGDFSGAYTRFLAGAHASGS